MVAHHRWRLQVACPACGASENITVVEDAEPPFTDPPRRWYEARGFKVAHAERATMTCVACGGAFPNPAN